MKVYVALFGVLIAGDAITTAIGLSLGMSELNPLGPVVAIGAKMVITTAALVLVAMQQRRWRPVTAGIFSMGLVAPVLWNMGVLYAASSGL